jgi:hypothetical protein
MFFHIDNQFFGHLLTQQVTWSHLLSILQQKALSENPTGLLI